jgi:Recombination endonuclease VII
LSNEITLDWDSEAPTRYVLYQHGIDRMLSIRQARERFIKFCKTEKPISASLSLSPLKGFHIRAKFSRLVDNWAIRDKWKDDGNRVIHEILGHVDGVKLLNGDTPEFFWQGKIIPYAKDKLVNFEETPIYDLYSNDQKERKRLRAEYRQRQRNKCYVCNNPLGKNAVLDHNHKTGLIRGLACRKCNNYLGEPYNLPPLMIKLGSSSGFRKSLLSRFRFQKST